MSGAFTIGRKKKRGRNFDHPKPFKKVSRKSREEKPLRVIKEHNTQQGCSCCCKW